MEIGAVTSHQRNMRSVKGMGSIELAITGFVGVLFACLAVDMGLMMLGNQILDRAARDAARAAAGQSTATTAKQAAIAALGNHKADGFYVQSPVLDAANFVYEDYSGTPEGQTVPAGFPKAGQTAHPFVSLTATTDVALPANLSFFAGAIGMNQGPLTTGKMTFKRNYYFPIVKQSLSSSFQ